MARACPQNHIPAASGTPCGRRAPRDRTPAADPRSRVVQKLIWRPGCSCSLSRDILSPRRFDTPVLGGDEDGEGCWTMAGLGRSPSHRDGGPAAVPGAHTPKRVPTAGEPDAQVQAPGPHSLHGRGTPVPDRGRLGHGPVVDAGGGEYRQAGDDPGLAAATGAAQMGLQRAANSRTRPAPDTRGHRSPGVPPGAGECLGLPAHPRGTAQAGRHAVEGQ